MDGLPPPTSSLLLEGSEQHSGVPLASLCVCVSLESHGKVLDLIDTDVEPPSSCLPDSAAEAGRALGQEPNPCRHSEDYSPRAALNKHLQLGEREETQGGGER